MSAEKKTSKGAPLSICERKFPEDPVLTRTRQPVAFSKFAAISFIANVRSDAAATVTMPHGFRAACDAGAGFAALAMKSPARSGAAHARPANAIDNIDGIRFTRPPLEFKRARS